jgi:hypothetical protein
VPRNGTDVGLADRNLVACARRTRIGPRAGDERVDGPVPPGRSHGLWYPLPRRGVRVVDGAALEKRCAKAPRVRIPPSPPQTRPSDRPAGATSVGFAVRGGLRERSPSGLWRRTGNAVRGNPSRVRIPPSPPLRAPAERPGGRRSSQPTGTSPRTRTSIGRAGVDLACRARRGTSGALNLQSAPAGLNSHPRSPFSRAAASSDVEDRVPRSGESRTVSGPEGSSTKRSSSGAAERPGSSRSSRWARVSSGRRWVHGNDYFAAPDRTGAS